MDDPRPRVKRLKRMVLAASLMSLGVLTMAAEHHVTGVTAKEQAAGLKRGLGVGPAPSQRSDASQPYEFGQPVQPSGGSGSYAAPIARTGVS